MVALLGQSEAHLEAVRVLVTFPSPGRPGMVIELIGTQSGANINGARIEYRATGPISVSTTRLLEQAPGKYSIPQQAFPKGTYTFTFTDRTLEQEALERSITTSLPRPTNADTFTWTWPATQTAANITWPLLILALITAGAGLFWLWKSKAETSKL